MSESTDGGRQPVKSPIDDRRWVAGKALCRLPGRARAGQSIVEVALVLPILLLLTFGVIGVSRVAQAKMAVISAAREAARSAVQAPPGGAVAAASHRGREI